MSCREKEIKLWWRQKIVSAEVFVSGSLMVGSENGWLLEEEESVSGFSFEGDKVRKRFPES